MTLTSDIFLFVRYNMGIVHSSHVTSCTGIHTNSCNIFSRFYHTLNIVCSSLHRLSNTVWSTLCPGGLARVCSSFCNVGYCSNGFSDPLCCPDRVQRNTTNGRTFCQQTDTKGQDHHHSNCCQGLVPLHLGHQNKLARMDYRLWQYKTLKRSPELRWAILAVVKCDVKMTFWWFLLAPCNTVRQWNTLTKYTFLKRNRPLKSFLIIIHRVKLQSCRNVLIPHIS